MSPSLCGLPVEIILHVLSLLPDDNEIERRGALNNFSLASRHLYLIATREVFRKYTLVLRRSELVRKRPCCPLTGAFLDVWDDHGVRARLGHLRSKARYVRDLRIVDVGQSRVAKYRRSSPGPAAFAPEFLPLLMSTLRSLKGVAAVSFETERYDASLVPVVFPVPLWIWLIDARLRTVSFLGDFEFPDDLQPPWSIRDLTVIPYTWTAQKMVENVRPPFLKFDYTWLRTGPATPFVPYPTLKAINIRVSFYTFVPNGHLFDFRSVPQVDVQVTIDAMPDYSSTPFGDPLEIRPTAPLWLFADDPSKLEVTHGQNVIMVRRRPQNQ
ncbi:hypothetical protein BC834DRAFT_971281 [Gloeopeniophorella convolvens]|nr:hypothetical protein BC834DRAFT_971281 [Gloeopeniophorella convolvens]